MPQNMRIRLIIFSLFTALAVWTLAGYGDNKTKSKNQKVTKKKESKKEVVKNMKKMPEEYWKEKLTPEQYHVLREEGTERAFTGEYCSLKKEGMYYCAACGELLFSSDTKFDSGTGWPSFWKAVDEKSIDLHEDHSYGMTRIEVRCGKCGGHLGHLFDDGPPPTGKRFCINSVSMTFVPKGKEK